MTTIQHGRLRQAVQHLQQGQLWIYDALRESDDGAEKGELQEQLEQVDYSIRSIMELERANG